MGERIVLKRLRSHLWSVRPREYLCRDPGGRWSPPNKTMLYDAANARNAAALHMLGSWSGSGKPTTVGVEVSADGGYTWEMHWVRLWPKPGPAATR